MHACFIIQSVQGRAVSYNKLNNMRGALRFDRILFKSCCSTKRSCLIKGTQQLRLLATTPSSGDENKRWWQRMGRSAEGKIFGTVIVGIVSWFIDRSINRSESKQHIELKAINKKIRDLYGPLYGNRLVRNTSFKAALGEHRSVKEYLETAKARDDPEMVRKWRTYVLNVLHPLDEKAERLIVFNAHLIAADGNFPEEFEHFLENFAHFKFMIQQWKNESGELRRSDKFTEFDFRMETNTSGCEHDRVLDHVTTRYSKLRARQKELSLDGSDDRKLANVFLRIFK